MSARDERVAVALAASGNSNWRGAVWFPLNYLLIESLQKFHRYLDGGDAAPRSDCARPPA